MLVRREAAGEDVEEEEFFVGEAELVERPFVQVRPLRAAVDDGRVEPVAEVLDVALDLARRDFEALGDLGGPDRTLLAEESGASLTFVQRVPGEARSSVDEKITAVSSDCGGAVPRPRRLRFWGSLSVSGLLEEFRVELGQG